jgi:hypothetical protein
MNHLLLCPALILGTALAAQAQLLPVPNARNPDWVQTDTKLGFRPSRPDSLPGSRDRMPIADPSRSGAPTMPNALGKKNLTNIGNTYRYWDADRKLAYEWQARPGSAAPDSTVTVHQQSTGAIYTYRRRPTPPTVMGRPLRAPSDK